LAPVLRPQFRTYNMEVALSGAGGAGCPSGGGALNDKDGSKVHLGASHRHLFQDDCGSLPKFVDHSSSLSTDFSVPHTIFDGGGKGGNHACVHPMEDNDKDESFRGNHLLRAVMSHSHSTHGPPYATTLGVTPG
jgi:hypothetical protein